MNDWIVKILLALVLAGVCAIAAAQLKERKARILAATEALMQKWEAAVQGTKMGPERKKLVIAELEATGIKVNKWLDVAIDDIVLSLNAASAWYTDKAMAATSPQRATGELTEAVEGDGA